LLALLIAALLRYRNTITAAWRLKMRATGRSQARIRELAKARALFGPGRESNCYYAQAVTARDALTRVRKCPSEVVNNNSSLRGSASCKLRLQSRSITVIVFQFPSA